MHSKTDNIEIMIKDDADEVIEELFKSLKNRVCLWFCSCIVL